VLPGVKTGSFNWVAFYAKVALSGVTQEITQYADILQRWYKITAFSPEKEYFATLVQDVTLEMTNVKLLETQKEEIESLLGDLGIVFNSTQDAMFLAEYKDGIFHYIRINTAHEKLSEFSMLDVVGKTPTELWGGKIGETLQAAYLRCMVSGEETTYEETIELPGGTRFFLTSLTPVYDNGIPRYLIGSRKDISESKKLELEKEELLQRLQAMFNGHSAVMLIIEPLTGRIVDASPSACIFYGYAKEEILDLYIYEINMLPKQEQENRRLMALNQREKYFVFPHRLKNGEIRMVDVYSCPIQYGEETRLFSIIFDVTDREKYKEDLNREKELLSTTLKSIGDGVVTTDNEGRITSLNKATQEIIGWSSDEVKNMLFSDVFKLKSEETGKEVEDPILKVIQTGKVIGLANHTILINKQGIPIPIADSAAPIKDENGQIFGVVMVFRDVSLDKEQREQILYLSYHDSLTGLYNRRFIEEEMKRLDTPSQLPLAVIMGDVNGLKLTNDVFSHEAGDKLLQKVSATLNENCRKGDIIARWGGDEFLILLPRTTLETAENMIQNMKTSFNEKSEGSLHISVSLGCAVKTEEDQGLQIILQEAEEWMYHQKLLEGKSYRNSIINTLLATLYEKSLETEEHAERLRGYCHTIGMKLNLSDKEMNELSLLALLHDIGKVGIQQSVLQKPGPLSPQEWEEMRRHPEIGYRIAQNTPELLIVAEYILSHHERWDGKGYPRGLDGTNIPLLCRILAVADAFDAMTSDRIYRKALSVKEAVAELSRNAGTQFDAEIVNLFIETIPDA
jgi:diguanylate cyclase